MCDLRIKLGSCWHSTNGVLAIGAGFVGDILYRAEMLAQIFHCVSSWEDFVQKIKTINGFFSVVVRRENQCYAAVDRVRSIPLFYAVYEGNFFISDDPEWIQDQIDGQIIDSLSLAEFLLTGYVTGPHTLNPRIQQLQAGEAIVVTITNEGISYQTERYYRFLTGKDETQSFSERELTKKLDEVTLAAVRRLISLADGRPIIVPLSGGLDSRLIVMSLKRLGYNDVIAFSYGVKGNWESRISQQVSSQLGIPWNFVEYRRERWKKWYWSEECQSYIKYANKLVSLAHLQDLPAVMELMKEKSIPKEAVIVPGHTGDFVSGGHIPMELLREQESHTGKVIKAIMLHHYVLMPFQKACDYAGLSVQDDQGRIYLRLRSCFDFTTKTTLAKNEDVGLYEYWEWQERQAKYIVNSVRVYDFFGVEWWLPWWDVEFMSFWEDVPLRLRVDRRLYQHYVKQIEAKLSINIPVSFGERIKKVVKRVDKMGIVKRIYRSICKPISPASSILALDGAWEMISDHGISILGMAALTQLSLIQERK